jgi:putative glutamine amidotransferase
MKDAPKDGWFLLSTSAEERAVPYADALKAVGVPAERIRVVTPAGSSPDGARELAGRAAGLVLCGGVDVAPERYGEEVLPYGNVEVLPERDELEWSLLDAARESLLPVWGVCRGIQVLNVYLGGSLWQDLPTQLPSEVGHSVSQPPDALVHTVRVLEPEMPLGTVLAREPALVNSRHHQAIKRLADGLMPVATSPDGLVEAVVLSPEAPDDWWVRGVQWHPENLVGMAQQRALWQDFIQAAEGRD